MTSARGAQDIRVVPLSAGYPVRTGPWDYDPAKLDSDRFPRGDEVGSPQLTFFPAPPSRRPAAAAIICAGGGYSGERIDYEGYRPALWLNSLGIASFVLRYRLPHGEAGKGELPAPLEDLQRAILLVRSQAGAFGIDPAKVGVMGWSAGGHLAAMSGTLFHGKDAAARATDRPDFLVLMYPVVTMRGATHQGSRANLLGAAPGEVALKRFSADEQVTPATPSTFIAVARDDDVVPLENSLLFSNACKASHVPCDLEVYEHGGHGFGMGKPGTDSMNWPKAFARWVAAQGLVETPAK